MLREEEQTWVELQPFLKSLGYQLRRRYQPSWKPPKKPHHTNEDTLPLKNATIIDAIRASDRRPVILKRIGDQSMELAIHQRMLSIPPAKRHVVSIYDVITLPDTDESLIIVLPRLHPSTLPAFASVYEILDYTLQLVEGLAHFHESRCIHRDVSEENIHMQAPGMYPKGWHFLLPEQYLPGDPITSKAAIKRAPYIPRTLASPSYLYMDFELSLTLGAGEPHYRLGDMGTHFSPEMGKNRVIDTFAADVWALGTVLKDVMNGPPFDQSLYGEARAILNPFMVKLMTEDPKQRPTAQHALQELRAIIQSLTDAQLRTTLSPKPSWSFTDIRYGLAAILQGQGDEKVLFAKLRGIEPPERKSFADGSLQEKIELAQRACLFLLHVGTEKNVLEWLAPKQPSK